MKIEPELYCRQSNDLIKEAELLKNIGHPVRLRILSALNQQDCQVKTISERLGLKQAVTSFQLLVLRRFGVVEGQRNGVEMHYSIIDPFVRRIVTILNETVSDSDR